MEYPGRLLALLAGLASSACGGDDSDTGTAPNVYTASDENPFPEACIATFTRDHPVLDPAREPRLFIQKGEVLLLDRYHTFRGAPEAEISFITAVGPINFNVHAATVAGLPFTSNCVPGAVKFAVGAFADTTLYKDEQLAEPACTLRRGQSFETTTFGYSYAGAGIDPEGAVYEFVLGALSGPCVGISSAFVAGTRVTLGRAIYLLLPIASFSSPK